MLYHAYELQRAMLKGASAWASIGAVGIGLAGLTQYAVILLCAILALAVQDRVAASGG